MHKLVQSLWVFVLIVFVQLSVSLLVSPPPNAAGTALGDLAAQMPAGTWQALPTINMTATLDNLSGNAGVMTVYTDDMVWDPAGGQAFVIGADHLAPEGPQFVAYTASDNTWRRLARPGWLSALFYFHGYDHSAINQAARILYHRPYGQNLVHRYNIPAQTWTVLTPPFSGDYANCCDALEYFPELGGLVWVRGNLPGVWLFHEGTQQWSLLGTVPQTGGTWQQAEYNPVHKVMIFTIGGLLHKLSNTGQITALGTPVSLYDGTAANGVLTVDPVSGDYLMLTPTSRNLYRYNVLTDSWQAQASQGRPNLSTLGVVATPVNTYGVILFASCIRGNCQAYVYKHAPGVADTQAPTSPTTLAATATSPSQIALTWTASTDNVGVTGYTVSRGGAQVGTAPSPNYADSGLTAQTSYSYTVRAYDAAGNTSAPSASASATTLAGGGGSDFTARCSAPGVLKCVSFDSSADIANTSWGSPFGILPGSGVAPAIDTTVKASGTGSLKFSIAAGAVGGSAGSYFTNFANDLSVQFGANSQFYVQFRQRMTPEFVSAGNFKSDIIGTGDKPGCTPSTSSGGKCYSSCTALEVVIQHPYTRGYPTMYNSCTGSASHGAYHSFEEPYGSFDFKMQNARPAPYCLYSQTNNGTQFPPTGNCFAYFPNEWMTFQVHITAGPRVGNEFTNSFVEMWMAREGQPSEPVFTWGPYNLSAGSSAEDQKYGKVWLLPYSGTAPFPAASYTWYDELIISQNKIADPGAGGAAPLPPTNFRVGN